MKLNEKKQKIEEIKKSLAYREIKNIGTMFFGYHSCGQVLRDTVYFGAKRIGIDFEVIDMTSSYFVGSKEHAVALQEAFGGKAYATEYVAFRKILWSYTLGKVRSETNNVRPQPVIRKLFLWILMK